MCRLEIISINRPIPHINQQFGFTESLKSANLNSTGIFTAKAPTPFAILIRQPMILQLIAEQQWWSSVGCTPLTAVGHCSGGMAPTLIPIDFSTNEGSCKGAYPARFQKTVPIPWSGAYGQDRSWPDNVCVSMRSLFRLYGLTEVFTLA